MFGFLLFAVGNFCRNLDVLLVKCLEIFPKVGFRDYMSLSSG